MTYRNRLHSWVEAKIVFFLHLWLQRQPRPQGAVHSGEVGCRLTADTVVGIDAAFFAAETVARQTDETTLIEGAPVLAVEVLSPSDKQSEIHEKVTLYLESGVQAVWIVDPFFRTVQVHQRGTRPKTFNDEHTLSGGNILPGLEIAVGELFPPQS
jgi:Uma2 family endonuclease